MPSLGGYFGCLVLIAMVTSSNAYAVCGDPTYKAEESKAAADKIVERLMKLRSPQWVWEAISTITVLQVATPKKFFGRWKSAKALETIVRDNWDYLELYDIEEIIFASRSLCLNPRRLGGRDLLNHIHDSMYMFLRNETDLPEHHHVYDFALFLSTLCINEYPIDPRLVDALMSLQNSDGTFGPAEHAADSTIGMLRPVYCLTQMENAQFNQTSVTTAMKRMRAYILTQVTRPHARSIGTYIGPDIYTSSAALVGLYKTMQPGENPNEDWRCREVMNTLGLNADDAEDEYDMQGHLLRITGTDYLDLQGPGYKCLDRKDLDPIPDGYKPTCDYVKPETCGMEDSSSEGPK